MFLKMTFVAALRQLIFKHLPALIFGLSSGLIFSSFLAFFSFLPIFSFSLVFASFRLKLFSFHGFFLAVLFPSKPGLPSAFSFMNLVSPLVWDWSIPDRQISVNFYIV